MPDPVSRRMRGLAVYDRPVKPPRRGEDSVLVLVHGSMDRGASFVKATRRLPEVEVIRYDRRGYGRSASAGVADAIDGHVDDLIDLVDAADAPCVLVGHSFGGVIALAAAQARPDAVRAVGAFEAPMPWTDWWPPSSAGGDAVGAADAGGAEAAAERFMRRMVGDERWERLPASTREARRQEGPALVAELIAMRSASAAPYDVGEIVQPIVTGHGSASNAHHIEAARRLAATARQGSLVIIDGARHGAHYSHPEEFADFLRTTLRAGSTVAPPPEDRFIP